MTEAIAHLRRFDCDYPLIVGEGVVKETGFLRVKVKIAAIIDNNTNFRLKIKLQNFKLSESITGQLTIALSR